SEQGRIVFPYLGEIEVAGQSESDIARTISKLLAQRGFIQDAQVNVTIYEYKNQQISMVGNIKAPGIYTLKSKTSLVDIIALAGGIGELGDYRAIVTRVINGKVIKHDFDLRKMMESADKSEPFFVQRNDVIYIPKAPMFYIHGEVQHSGNYRIEPNMTVDQAISLGGGLTPRGTFRDMTIKRQDANGIVQELEDIELSDKVLENDVIFIDERLF
ncbi:partial Polysialic acid transport protein KpsD, partial [Patescibacteria group bacterium]